MTTEPAQLNVLISGGFSGAYEQLLPEFERTSGIKVKTGSGASQGAGPQTIAAQLARGVPTDVVILSREGLTELITANRIAAGTDIDLAQVGLGVAIRSGTPKPDVSTVEAFKQIALKARIVAVPASTSGIWLTANLFPRSRHRRSDRRQEDAARLGRGRHGRRRDCGYRGHAGQRDYWSRRASRSPAASHRRIQFMQAFSAAAVAGTKQIEGARKLIAYLASARACEAIRNSGMEPFAVSR